MDARGHRVILAILLAAGVGSAWAAGEPPSPLRIRADEVLAGSRPLGEVRLEAVWTRPGKHHLVVWGSGVGLWNREKQFKLSNKEVRSLLELLVTGGYFELPDKPAPPWGTPAGRQPQAPQVLRAIGVKIGDLSKLVSQNNRVPKLESFDKLVGELFARCERAAAAGVAAKDLEDGLEKIASGTLAVEVLAISVSEPPLPAGASSPPADGLIVKLEEGELVRIVQPSEGELTETRWRPGRDEIRQVAALVREAGFSKIPGNLYRPRYVDVQVVLLNHRKNVQARPFAGMDPAARQAEQAALERIVRQLLGVTVPGSGGDARDAR